MKDKSQAVAWWVDAPVADDDPHRAVKLRAAAIDQAAEVLAEVTRKAGVSVRADLLEEAAALLCADGFDAEETWDAGLAAGLTDADLDAAGNVALELWKVEHGL